MPPPRDLAQTFGSRLRFLRAIKGLTQADLADRLNVSVKHIGRIERGEASPSFSLIQSLASVLETPPLNFFLQFEDDSTHSGTTGAASAPEADKPLCKQLCLAPDLAIWAPGDTQQLTYWSDSLYAMLGYAPRSVSPSAKRFLQHVVSREQPAAKDFLATIARDGQPEAALLCVNIVTRGKQHRKLLLKTETLRTYPGLPPQTQLIIQDITECVALNEAIATRQEELEAYVLHKNQDLAMALEKVQQEADWRAKAEQGLRIYEQMVHYAHDAQAFVDAAGTIIAVNRAYERLSGMAAHEVVGRGWAEYLAAYWGQEAFENIFKAKVEDALHQGRHCSIQEWRTYQNGRRRFVHVIYTPCKEKDRLLGVVVTIHDLTDFMKMHERLEHQEQIYRQVLETAGEAIALLDTNLSVTYVNPKTISLFGFTEEELLGSSALTFVHPEDIDTAQQHLTQTLARHPTRFIARLVAKNGRVVWTQAATTTMHDAAGAVDGLLIMLMDITDLKTTELALRQREELLELTTEASLGLLRDRAHGQVVNDILARLGSLLAADRVYLFKNHDTEQTGEMLTSQIFEWAAPGISPQMGNPARSITRF